MVASTDLACGTQMRPCRWSPLVEAPHLGFLCIAGFWCSEMAKIRLRNPMLVLRLVHVAAPSSCSAPILPCCEQLTSMAGHRPTWRKRKKTPVVPASHDGGCGQVAVTCPPEGWWAGEELCDHIAGADDSEKTGIRSSVFLARQGAVTNRGRLCARNHRRPRHCSPLACWSFFAGPPCSWRSPSCRTSRRFFTLSGGR